MRGWSGGHAWDTTRYGDTINEQAVRILLECILVESETAWPIITIRVGKHSKALYERPIHISCLCLRLHYQKQDCIPVGCVPAAH